MKAAARILMLLFAVAGGMAAQNAPAAPASDSVATIPEQVRRVEPPPANASAEALEFRGDQLRGQKAYVDALDYYRAAIAQGETAALRNKMGITHLNLLRYDLAKKEFERAIKLNPQYSEAHNNVGVVHYTRRKYRPAIKAYQKAIKLNPGSASFLSNLGTAHFARKEYQKAAKAYAQALAIDPEVFDRRSLAGVSAHLSSPGDRAHYYYVLAKMFSASGNHDRALEYLRKSMEEGYPDVKKAYTEAEFAELRKDARFEQLMQSNIPRLETSKNQ